MNSIYIIDWWKQFTNKWLKKLIIITISFLLLMIIYFLQPHFGNTFNSQLVYPQVSLSCVEVISGQDSDRIIYCDTWTLFGIIRRPILIN